MSSTLFLNSSSCIYLFLLIYLLVDEEVRHPDWKFYMKTGKKNQRLNFFNIDRDMKRFTVSLYPWWGEHSTKNGLITICLLHWKSNLSHWSSPTPIHHTIIAIDMFWHIFWMCGIIFVPTVSKSSVVLCPAPFIELVGFLGALLLTWINFNPSMDK